VVLAFVEHDDGVPEDTTLEMLTMARDVAGQVGEPVQAVVFGYEEGVADELGSYGVETVHAVEYDDVGTYAPMAWAKSLSQLVSKLAPEVVLAPGSERGHEVLAHVAARHDVPMVANCLEVTAGDPYEVRRQRWGGTLIEQARLSTEPRLLTAAPNELSAAPADNPAEADVESFTPDLVDSDFAVRVTRIEESDEEGIPLSEARIVVGGGRGVGSAEDFDKLEELTDQLDAALGASRAAVNEGWRSHDDQIGQTGAKISPTLYIPCGISGAVQHMVGAKGAEYILPVNTDPEAAIIEHADYAVIGDLHEVVPELNEALRERTG
jgi:electron transfer flavoprotein alpha subunit